MTSNLFYAAIKKRSRPNRPVEWILKPTERAEDRLVRDPTINQRRPMVKLVD